MIKSDFAGFDLSPEVFQAVCQQGYTTPTEIQRHAIPPILSGRDVIGHAKTGTGKTAAFALPLLSGIDTSQPHPQICVLAPTRELAIQVADAFGTYASHLDGLRIVTIYGGAAYGPQISQLKRGAHIVVGTPGRVIDHMKRGNLKLDQLKSFVLDEADEMLNMGFAEDVKWILSQSSSERQTLLFSATMPDNVRTIANAHLQDPKLISLHSDTMTTTTVSQRVCTVVPREKAGVLASILESETTDGVIVFVKTKEMSSRLSEILCQRGYRASALNGDMRQQQRERTVEELKSGRINIVVATDVAARGLDVERISHVVNYDFPHDPQAYVHRIGRTGRAGREGHAILLVSPREKSKLRRLEKVTGQKMTWMDKPSFDTILDAREKDLRSKILETIGKHNVERSADMISSMLADHPELTINQVAAALAALATKATERRPQRKNGEERNADRSRKKKQERRQGRDQAHAREQYGSFDTVPPKAFAKRSDSDAMSGHKSDKRKGKAAKSDRRRGANDMAQYR
ncbi:MAG: DEAD/DEAH box helicase, partial [Planctomycetota bacterium]